MVYHASASSVLFFVLVAARHGLAARITRTNAIRFDARKWAGNGRKVAMKLSRQGEEVFAGVTSVYDFPMSDLHKTFIAKLTAFSDDDSKLVEKTCTVPLAVRGRNAFLCGTALFQQRSLRCDAMDESSRRQIADMPVFEPASDRGFAVEFEFVARGQSQRQWSAFREPLEDLFRQGIVTHNGRLLAYQDDVGAASTTQKVQGLRQCFLNATKPSASLAGRTCSSDADCALNDFCFSCDACLENLVDHGADEQQRAFFKSVLCGTCTKGASMCVTRDEEKEGSPTPLWRWYWEKDESVAPLSVQQVRTLGTTADQAVGDPFELTAPGPPNVLSGRAGATSLVEVLGTLRYMGIQAGPTQGLHVHVNVLNSNAPGRRLTIRGIISVWVAWAKYQHIINEMLSPGRVDVPYARPLILGDCEIDERQQNCRSNPCSCVHRFFRQMHEYLHDKEVADVVNHTAGRPATPATSSTSGSPGQRNGFDLVQTFIFCNRVLVLPASPQLVPCKMRYPMQRYFQVNLVPLVKYGTIEFRPHSSTSDPARVGRWAQFIVGFVDYFGSGEGMEEISSKYLEGSWAANHDALKRDQEVATATDLFGKLGDKVDASSLDYFMGREFEKNDVTCESHGHSLFEGMALTQDCKVHVEQEVLQATVRKTNKLTGIESMQVHVPLGYEEGDYINVELPDGEVRTIRIPQDGKGGFHARTIKFERDPGDETRALLLAEISMEHRCCCDDGDTCLWFASDMLAHGGHCPRIGFKKEGSKGRRVKRACAIAGWSQFDSKWWMNSARTSNFPGRCRVVSMEDDPTAYFTHNKC